MPIIPKLRQQGKSIWETWVDLKRRHVIDDDPMDKLMNEVEAYYCIVKPKYAEHVGGLTHIKVLRHKLDSMERFANTTDCMEYIHFAEEVWAETREGKVFCYKCRHTPKDKMKISDEDFFMLKLQAVTV